MEACFSWPSVTRSERALVCRFCQDLHTTEDATHRHPVLTHLVTNDLRYDARSAFTLSLNHRDKYTGITDHDRALTTRRFAELAMSCLQEGVSIDDSMARLGAEFRTPGHIPVCRGSKRWFGRAPGSHGIGRGPCTRLAGTAPVVIGAEMLQPEGDHALGVDDARRWADERDIPFLEGADVIAALAALEEPSSS